MHPRLTGLFYAAMVAVTVITVASLAIRPYAGTPCPTTPGAGAGASTLGQTDYISGGTTTVSNVIFDASHSDDLVRVNNGKVIFENVTFRGTGTGAAGHTLEIKVGGSAEVRNSVFEGAPVEDTIQTEGNGDVLVECNRIGGRPGEDHIDTKGGNTVTIRNNTFVSEASALTLQIHNPTSPVHAISNYGIHRIFYENGQTGGTIRFNDVLEDVWLYDTTNILVEGNTIPILKHGESTGTRDPVDAYYMDNRITTVQFNGGTCYKTGNTGSSLSDCTSGAPPWY